MKSLIAQHVKLALKELSSTEKAQSSARFFKTAPGQYGEGDQFIGVTVPEQRKIARRFRNLALIELSKLLKSPIHEERLTALLILVDQFEQAMKQDRPTLQKQIVEFYLQHRAHINNWDLVDSSAASILGAWLLHQEQKEILFKFARSSDLWEKRIAMIATYALIKAGEFEDALLIAEILVYDSHDLIQKAVGWMLREVGNRNRNLEELFLERFAATMPRTMLRYAIEKFPPDQRQAYLKLKAS